MFIIKAVEKGPWRKETCVLCGEKDFQHKLETFGCCQKCHETRPFVEERHQAVKGLREGNAVGVKANQATQDRRRLHRRGRDRRNQGALVRPIAPPWPPLPPSPAHVIAGTSRQTISGSSSSG